MYKKIPIGIEFYKQMIDKEYYYVDKTLAMTMLKAYFEDERDKDGVHIDNSRYFVGKKIAGCGEKYVSMQGQYPVINLSLKSAKQPTFEMAYNILVRSIADEFGRHLYVLDGDTLSDKEKERFEKIYYEKASADEYAAALAFLSVCLQKYHGRNTVILIDEYDVPLENSYFEGFYDQMIAFIRSLFESALKTNTVLEFAVITGCLRISRESIFTGLNNLEVISILSEESAEHFGFTVQESVQMLDDYGLSEKQQELLDWYDGYLFGKTEICSPWSVINYVKARHLLLQKGM